MAANKQAKAAEKVEVEVDGNKFTLDTNLAVPPRPSGGRGGKGTTFPFGQMKAGQSFLLPAEVDSSLTDPSERAQAFKDEQRRLANRIASAIRRFKVDHPNAVFETRSVNDDTLGHGVRVWRAADAEPEPAAAG